MISSYHERESKGIDQRSAQKRLAQTWDSALPMRLVLCKETLCGKLRPPVSGGAVVATDLAEQPMERILFLTFRDQQVLLADCSDCSAEELAAVIDDVPKHVTVHPHGSVLLLADFSRSIFTKETVEHLKVAAVFDRPHVKKSAWVLTQNLPKTLYESVGTFSGREIPIFETREAALEYLVAE
jgi:hypothetical protein